MGRERGGNAVFVPHSKELKGEKRKEEGKGRQLLNHQPGKERKRGGGGENAVGTPLNLLAKKGEIEEETVDHVRSLTMRTCIVQGKGGKGEGLPYVSFTPYMAALGVRKAEGRGERLRNLSSAGALG